MQVCRFSLFDIGIKGGALYLVIVIVLSAKFWTGLEGKHITMARKTRYKVGP